MLPGNKCCRVRLAILFVSALLLPALLLPQHSIAAKQTVLKKASEQYSFSELVAGYKEAHHQRIQCIEFQIAMLDTAVELKKKLAEPVNPKALAKFKANYWVKLAYRENKAIQSNPDTSLLSREATKALSEAGDACRQQTYSYSRNLFDNKYRQFKELPFDSAENELPFLSAVYQLYVNTYKTDRAFANESRLSPLRLMEFYQAYYQLVSQLIALYQIPEDKSAEIEQLDNMLVTVEQKQTLIKEDFRQLYWLKNAEHTYSFLSAEGEKKWLQSDLKKQEQAVLKDTSDMLSLLRQLIAPGKASQFDSKRDLIKIIAFNVRLLNQQKAVNKRRINYYNLIVKLVAEHKKPKVTDAKSFSDNPLKS